MIEEAKTWLVVFRDDPAILEHRKAFGQQHISYLQENRDTIVLAGGLRNKEETPFAGGAWLVSANSTSDVESLVQNDPYYNPEHRKYDISYWGIIQNSLSQGASSE